jgi:hypothetical protein
MATESAEIRKQARAGLSEASGASASGQAAAPNHEFAEVTYVPSHGGPLQTKMGGIVFRANVPTKVPRSVTVDQLLRKEHENPDGSIVSRSIEGRVKLVEKLKRNPFFIVDGVQAKRVEPASALPDTSDKYRNYALMWITRSTTAEGIRARWAAEHGLRESLGVSQEDLSFLSPLLEMKIKECGEMENGALLG